MNSYVVLSCGLLLMASSVQAMGPTPRVHLDVQVVNNQGGAIKDAEVRVEYPGRISGKGELITNMTDEEGRASFVGSSFFDLRVKAAKTGYYYSHQEVRAFERIGGESVYSDQKVKIILREVKNPAPMHACRNFQAKVPVLGKPVGFDMMKADWVSPYGRGEVADILLEVAGEWNGARDHDSLLRLCFPNQGDGYVLFKADDQSQLRSPYEAPLSGYMPNKSWRKMKKPVEGAMSEWESIDDVAPDAIYILRVSTVIDSNGGVTLANYGKVYGDFEFWGATLDERYGYVVFSYYLNPTPNDRNLEYAPSRNLIQGLRSANQPEDP